MKLILTSAILLIFFTFQSCNFNKSIKKDLISGAVYKADGLSSDDVKMEVNGIQTKNNTFTIGDKIELTFDNIVGFKKMKGMAFPGMSICILRNGSDTLMSKSDLLADYKDGTDLTPLLLKAYFNAPYPEHENEKYKVLLTIWDEKGPGKIRYEMPFQVKKSTFLSVKSNQLECSSLYLWDETTKKVVNNESIDVDDEYILIIEGLDGFDLVDGKVFPAVEIGILDKNGNYLLYEENVLESSSEFGVEPDQIKENQVTVTITFTAGKIANPCVLKATISDLKNPAKKIAVKGDIVIQ